MCDDFYGDFDSDYDEEHEEYGDDGFCDDGFHDNEAGGDRDTDTESDDGHWDGLQWQDWMIIGPLSEEIARKKREQGRSQRELTEIVIIDHPSSKMKPTG